MPISSNGGWCTAKSEIIVRERERDLRRRGWDSSSLAALMAAFRGAKSTESRHGCPEGTETDLKLSRDYFNSSLGCRHLCTQVKPATGFQLGELLTRSDIM